MSADLRKSSTSSQDRASSGSPEPNVLDLSMSSTSSQDQASSGSPHKAEGKR